MSGIPPIMPGEYVPNSMGEDPHAVSARGGSSMGQSVAPAAVGSVMNSVPPRAVSVIRLQPDQRRQAQTQNQQQQQSEPLVRTLRIPLPHEDANNGSIFNHPLAPLGGNGSMGRKAAAVCYVCKGKSNANRAYHKRNGNKPDKTIRMLCQSCFDYFSTNEPCKTLQCWCVAGYKGNSRCNIKKHTDNNVEVSNEKGPCSNCRQVNSLERKNQRKRKQLDPVQKFVAAMPVLTANNMPANHVLNTGAEEHVLQPPPSNTSQSHHVSSSPPPPLATVENTTTTTTTTSTTTTTDTIIEEYSRIHGECFVCKQPSYKEFLKRDGNRDKVKRSLCANCFQFFTENEPCKTLQCWCVSGERGNDRCRVKRHVDRDTVVNNVAGPCSNCRKVNSTDRKNKRMRLKLNQPPAADGTIEQQGGGENNGDGSKRRKKQHEPAQSPTPNKNTQHPNELF